MQYFSTRVPPIIFWIEIYFFVTTTFQENQPTRKTRPSPRCDLCSTGIRKSSNREFWVWKLWNHKKLRIRKLRNHKKFRIRKFWFRKWSVRKWSVRKWSVRKSGILDRTERKIWGNEQVHKKKLFFQHGSEVGPRSQGRGFKFGLIWIISKSF